MNERLEGEKEERIGDGTQEREKRGWMEDYIGEEGRRGGVWLGGEEGKGWLNGRLKGEGEEKSRDGTLGRE